MKRLKLPSKIPTGLYLKVIQRQQKVLVCFLNNIHTFVIRLNQENK